MFHQDQQLEDKRTLWPWSETLHSSHLSWTEKLSDHHSTLPWNRCSLRMACKTMLLTCFCQNGRKHQSLLILQSQCCWVFTFITHRFFFPTHLMGDYLCRGSKGAVRTRWEYFSLILTHLCPKSTSKCSLMLQQTLHTHRFCISITTLVSSVIFF